MWCCCSLLPLLAVERSRQCQQTFEHWDNISQGHDYTHAAVLFGQQRSRLRHAINMTVSALFTPQTAEAPLVAASHPHPAAALFQGSAGTVQGMRAVRGGGGWRATTRMIAHNPTHRQCAKRCVFLRTHVCIHRLRCCWQLPHLVFCLFAVIYTRHLWLLGQVAHKAKSVHALLARVHL